MKKDFRFIYILLISFGFAYVTLTISGLLAAESTDVRTVLYSTPLYIFSLLLFVIVVADVVMSNKWKRIEYFTLVMALAFAIAGYLVDGFMGYDLSAVITEGQTLSVWETVKAGGKGHSGRYARVRDDLITLESLTPSFSSEGGRIEGLEGKLTIQEPNGEKREAMVSLKRSYHGETYRFIIEDFGYSPRYELWDEGGRLLDSAFVYLRLFPPGSEDYFRLLSPLTYYMKYFPSDDSDARIGIRIARNRDIVFNGEVGIGEQFSYENAKMDFPEVRKWTRLRIWDNPGKIYLYIALMAFVISVSAGIYIRKRECRHASIARQMD